MLRFIKKMLIRLLSFGGSLADVAKVYDRIKCASNQSCQVTLTIVDVNTNEPLYYQFVVSVSKCGASCNTIDDPYVPIYVSNKVKNINLKVI